MIAVGTILGETAEKAEPARKWIDPIARLIWGAQIQERTQTLQAPEKRGQIPPPRKQISPPKKSVVRNLNEIDEEIPFQQR